MPNRSFTAQFAEACISPSASIESWALRVCNAAEPIFERGGGEGGSIILNPSRTDAARGIGTITVAGAVAAETFAKLFDIGLERVFNLVGEDVSPAFRPFRITLLSRLFGRSTMRGFAPWEQFFAKNIYEDQIGIDASDQGFSVLSTSVREGGWAKERQRDLRTIRRLLTRSLTSRLRSLTDTNADAVIAPDGHILHAPEGLGKDTAAILSKAVQSLERARVDARAEEQGERLWDELLAGHWSLVEHIDSDGKRVMLLGRSASSGRLTEAERILLRRIQQTDPIKRIAIDLNLSIAAVSERISAALAKLGFHSRAEYVRFCTSR